MKILSLLLAVLFTISCGDRVYTTIIPPADDGADYHGYFNLDGGSGVNCIFLSQKAQNLVDIESDCQSLVTENPQNNTLGQFPTISVSNLVVVNNEIRYTRNINYTSGNDIEEDINGSNITGSRRTDILIRKVNGKLVVKLDIYRSSNNDNLNYIVASRIFNEL